jgi:hypothetical protein
MLMAAAGDGNHLMEAAFQDTTEISRSKEKDAA